MSYLQAVGVEYVSPDWGKPGVSYFRCVLMSATLGVEACAANWRAAHAEGDTDRALWRCKTCQVGSIHAGETAASLSPLRGAMVCARCGTGCTRLIHDWLCVSCYNRQLEWIKGKNGRGTAPVMMTPLYRRAIKVVEAGRASVFARDLTASTAELMIGALRDRSNVVQFAFHGGAAALFSQGMLW